MALICCSTVTVEVADKYCCSIVRSAAVRVSQRIKAK